MGGRASDLPAPASAETATSPSYSYKLAGGDKVRVIVYDSPDLGGEFTVNGAGVLALPLIGDVNASGLTSTELQTLIQSRLAEGFVKDPRVNVEALTLRPFYILGEVNRPGEYAYANGLTVLSAVAQGGGFTYRANTRKVLIKHAGDQEAREYQITSSTPIAPGDVVSVKERWF